jgi:DNA-binding transcriptional LysR family regulator
MPGFEWIREPPYVTRVVFRANDPVGLASAAAAGLGLAAVPCIIGETDPQLRRVEALGIGFSPLFLVMHEELRDTARVRVVGQLIEDMVRANHGILMGRGAELTP